MFKKIAVMLVASIFMVGVVGAMSGCNTMHGVGQDVENGGDKIKQEANEHR